MRHRLEEEILGQIVEIVLASVQIVQRECANDLEVFLAKARLFEKIRDQSQPRCRVARQERRVHRSQLRSRFRREAGAQLLERAREFHEALGARAALHRFGEERRAPLEARRIQRGAPLEHQRERDHRIGRVALQEHAHPVGETQAANARRKHPELAHEAPSASPFDGTIHPVPLLSRAKTDAAMRRTSSLPTVRIRSTIESA